MNAIDAALHILQVYSIVLPPGECYPTEPFGEVGPDEFVSLTIKELEKLRVLLDYQQKYIGRLERQLDECAENLKAWSNGEI